MQVFFYTNLCYLLLQAATLYNVLTEYNLLVAHMPQKKKKAMHPTFLPKKTKPYSFCMKVDGKEEALPITF